MPRPTEIAAGPDGALWFPLELDALGRLTVSGKAKRVDLPGIHPFDITTGPDGDLWYSTSSGYGLTPNVIGRVTTAGQITQYPLPGSGVAVGIGPGADGNVWFAVEGYGIGKITPDGTVTE